MFIIHMLEGDGLWEAVALSVVKHEELMFLTWFEKETF